MALSIDEVHPLDLVSFFTFISLIDAQAVDPQQSRGAQISDVYQCFV